VSLQQSVTILGSTGSIGVNTLDVISRHPERYRVYALSANNNVDALKQQCLAFKPVFAVMHDAKAAATLASELGACGTEVLSGVEGLQAIATHDDVDCVMAAIVGGIGLAPTYAAARAGKKVLLANKEALVMAGSLFMEAVAESGCLLLPIDSEHNAIFQCLPVNKRGRFENRDQDGFARIVLTGSGGPFLHADPSALAAVTPAQACAHPNWQMGQKISVDSATMVNKALELIEACFLFDLDESAIDIMIHPQSVVHSMVYYRDGSVLAQLGNPDMRTPISYGLAWPERINAGVAELDLAAIARLDFLTPDLVRFPCLKLGREVARAGASAPVILNAANELAVTGFLAGSLRFDQIPAIIDATLNELPASPVASLEEVLAADAAARDCAARHIREIAEP
jgi:1-deoxy-D-xylulose-5-phosphate reductoisomerase